MGLTSFLDAVSDYLRKDLSPAPAIVGASEPAGAVQLPAVTLSIARATSPHPGIGATPRAPMTGALRTSARIDLAAPFLDSPDGPVTLLSADRMSLQLPHGRLVADDGKQPPPPADVSVRVTTANHPQDYTVVTGAPSATLPQVLLDAVTGTLTFGAALPATGTIDAGYYIGTWEVRSERFAGELRVDAIAGDAAAADGLSRRIEVSLAADRVSRIAGLRSLAPTAWGSLGDGGGDGGSLPGVPSRRRSLTYRFDYEREQPVVSSSGGPIERVHVTSTPSVVPQGAADQFDVTRRVGSR